MKSILFIILSFTSFNIVAQAIIVNKSETLIEIEDEDRLSIKRFDRITINNEDGYQAAVYRNGEDRFSKITSLKMTVFDKNGKKVKKLGKLDSREYSFNDQNEVNDTKMVVLSADYQHYPFTVEIESVTQSNKGFLTLPLWFPRSEFRMQVDMATLTIVKPASFEINRLEENLDKVLITLDGDNEIWTWQVSNLESIDSDMSIKQFYNEQPKVFLGPRKFVLDKNPGSFDSWESFGNWFLNLNDNDYQLLSETREFLDQTNGDSVRQAVYDIFNFMQSRTRYISIQLGIGGFQSLPTEFVDERGFGDCKALSNYLRSMLDYKGISSNFILVKAGNDVLDINTDIISNQFNHVFLAVPLADDTIYLECTNQMLPPNYLSTHTDDRDVLWIEKNNSKIIRSPIYDETANTVKTKCVIDMDRYGNASLKVDREKRGVFYDDIMFYKTVTEQQREQYLYSHFDFKDFIIDDFSYGERKDYEPAYMSKYEITANNLAREVSDKLLITVNMLPDIDSYFPYNNYTQFAEIKRGFTLEDRVTVTVPETFWLSKIPSIMPLEENFGSYECTIKDLENGSVEIRRKVVLKKGLYQSSDFSEFDDFIKKIKKADRTKLILESGT
ncbi:MAG: DUF3857 domain-containing protein [Cyclobacteriaceae bacterium]